MTEGRRCQVHLLDDRKLELLVQVRPSGAIFLVSSVINECAAEVDLVMNGRGLSTLFISLSSKTCVTMAETRQGILCVCYFCSLYFYVQHASGVQGQMYI